jgi:glucosylceramidase
MRDTDGKSSRRGFLKLSALGLGAAAAGSSPSFSPAAERSAGVIEPGAHAARRPSEISAWVTNARDRFAKTPSMQWQLQSAWPPPSATAPPSETVRLVRSNKFQDILGFGGCFSDASCYVINQLRPAAREEFLHDLFHPSAMGLSVNRTCIGAADSAAKLYSYDDGDEDPELKRFSIDHDREYILPILRRVRGINPEVFYFSSPWSPPGWMKWNKSMLGGAMSRQYLSSYAQYFLKFLEAYAAEGVAIQAITTQNEIDTDQHGQMPACTWSQECETEFITDHLGPLFEKTNTSTKIWILDHNYVYWGRVISQFDDPQFRRYAYSVAWHGYVGEPSMMSKVHAAHSEADMYFTEGSTDYNDPHYQDDWTKWSATYTAVLNNWCRSAAAWNIATDEHGQPNIGPYPCGGIVIINPHTQEITRSGQYWALAHFSRAIRRGGRRIESQSEATNLSHIAVENPGGQTVLVLTNPGTARTIQVLDGAYAAPIHLAENSIATMVWS